MTGISSTGMLQLVRPPMLLVTMIPMVHSLRMPPVPPEHMGARVTYGAESGRFKGSDETKLLNPPIHLEDPLFGLREKSAATLEHIAEENVYADEMLALRDRSIERIHQLLMQHIDDADDQAELWYRGSGNAEWEYAQRKGNLEHGQPYPRYVRRQTQGDGSEQLMLDTNAVPARLMSTLSEGVSFTATVKGVAAFVPSPNGRRVAYTVDTTGDERYALMISDVDPLTGAVCAPFDWINDVDVDIAWGLDDSELFYATMDSTARPCQLHRLDWHNLPFKQSQGVSADGLMDALTSEKQRSAPPSGFGASTSRKGVRDSKNRSVSKARSASRTATAGKPSRKGGGSRAFLRDVPEAHLDGDRERRGRSTLVFEETDARYRMSLRRTLEGSRLLIHLASRDSSECWALRLCKDSHVQDSVSPADRNRMPLTQRWETGIAHGDGWHCLGKREQGLTYSADYQIAYAPGGDTDGGDDDCATARGTEGAYILMANDGGDALEGALHVLHEGAAIRGEDRQAWLPIALDTSDLFGSASLMGVQAFPSCVAIEARYDGASALFVRLGSVADAHKVDGQWLQLDGDALAHMTVDSAMHAASRAGAAGVDSLHDLSPGGQWCVQLCATEQQDISSGGLRVEVSHPLCPPRILEYRPAAYASAANDSAPGTHDEAGSCVVLCAHAVPAGFQAERYVCGRLWARASDGARVPMSILVRRDSIERDGQRLAGAGLLYGYGSYGFCSDPSWDAERLAMVDSGILCAIGHVRGGGEMGSGWHAAGRRASKRRSFSDLIVCAEELVSSELVVRGALALEGRSAGGLLVGAAANLRPELFCALLASVPFLDAAGTLQDATLPLTANEWEEFGNPNEVDGHASVLAFSPTHNVKPKAAYPACLLLPALQDARTGYWEAHKFAHAIRSNGLAASEQRPVLVRTDMEGGHFRPADKAQRAAGRAMELGFLLHELEETLSTPDR